MNKNYSDFHSYLILSVFFLLGLSGLFLMVHYISDVLTEIGEPSILLFKSLFNQTVYDFDIADKVIFGLKAFCLVIASILIIIFLLFISAISGNICYRAAASKYDWKKYPLRISIIKTFEWNIKRLLFYTKPILIGSSVIGSSIVLLILLFNQLVKFASINITLSIFISVFLAFFIASLFIFCLIISIWNFMSSAYGIEIISSEPSTNFKQALMRSRSFLLNSKPKLYLYLSYFIFITTIILEIVTAVTPGATSYLTDTNIIITLLLGNSFLFLATGYLKAQTYIYAILDKEDYLMLNLKCQN